MARKTIYINSLINKAMHRPYIKETGEVLYPVLDNYSGKTEGASNQNKSSQFMAKSKIAYNSPTNIRRLFITCSGVVVEYYLPPVIQGSESRRITKVAFSSVIDSDLGVSNFKDIAQKLISYQEEVKSHMLEKQINKNAKEPIQYTVTGNPFGVISNIYACNNIEEIYIDWTMMISQDIQPYAGGSCHGLDLRLLVPYINNEFSSGIVQDKSGILKGLFKTSNGLNSDNAEIRTRFPRLKLIAFVPSLDNILNDASSCSMIPDKEDSEQRILEKSATWFEKMKSTLEQYGCTVAILRPLNKINREFKVKDSQYKFDRDKLKVFVNVYNERTADALRNARYGDAGSTYVSISDEEQFIKELLENNQDEANKILTLACIGHSTSEIKELLVSLSKPTRSKVANIIKFDLGQLNK